MLRFLGVGAIGLLMSSTAWAATGYVDVTRGHSEVDAVGVAETNSTTLAAAGALELRGRSQMQFDGLVSFSDELSGANDFFYGGTGHWVRRERGWMLGGFAGFMDSDGADLLWAGGAESALYFGRFTLAGTLAYAQSSGIDLDAIIAQGEGRYFFTKNLRADVAAGVINYSLGAFEYDATLLGAGAEFRFPDSSVSVFGRYDTLDFDSGLPTVDTAKIGLRFNFDSNLAFRDEAGASLVSVPTLTALLQP
ncbi:MAG: hypothetical protein JNJ73_02525 [Hyphomonadaceae bacterium]|nr:hypothetical protein [Hyphomonadaceae bacterium]